MGRCRRALRAGPGRADALLLHTPPGTRTTAHCYHLPPAHYTVGYRAGHAPHRRTRAEHGWARAGPGGRAGGYTPPPLPTIPPARASPLPAASLPAPRAPTRRFGLGSSSTPSSTPPTPHPHLPLLTPVAAGTTAHTANLAWAPHFGRRRLWRWFHWRHYRCDALTRLQQDRRSVCAHTARRI